MDIDKREKAKEGLRRCAVKTKNMCKDCPYASDDSCVTTLAQDIVEEYGDVIFGEAADHNISLNREMALVSVNNALMTGKHRISLYTQPNGEISASFYPDGKLDIKEISAWLQKRFPNDPPNYWEQEIKDALENGDICDMEMYSARESCGWSDDAPITG